MIAGCGIARACRERDADQWQSFCCNAEHWPGQPGSPPRAAGLASGAPWRAMATSGLVKMIASMLSHEMNPPLADPSRQPVHHPVTLR